jgi:D-ribose pyranase
MLIDGILNPQLASLLARFRHANALAIVDVPFPTYSRVETIELVLDRDIPTISQVLDVIVPRLDISGLVMAQEFTTRVAPDVQQEYRAHHRNLPTEWVPHSIFKKLVGRCLGVVHTGDTVPYSNVIVLSGNIQLSDLHTDPE